MSDKMIAILVGALLVPGLGAGAFLDHANPPVTQAITQVTQAPGAFTPTSPEQEQRDQPVTEEDLRILRRADRILISSVVWNRHDTRKCTPTDKTWSLFCALEKASLEVLGEYRHREVALQEVRFAVDDVAKGADFEHRLMDYNNLESTTFADIKRVLKMATDRVAARLAAQKRAK